MHLVNQLPGDNRRRLATFLTYGVAFNGVLIIASTLPEQFLQHRHLEALPDIVTGVPLIVGLTLLYLSLQLRRRKRIAWIVAMIFYGLVIAAGLAGLIAFAHQNHDLTWLRLGRSIVLPGLLLFGLTRVGDYFTVKSDIRSFALSLRFIALVLSITFVYGVSGFLLLDKHDFRQEVAWTEAIHRTVDQFGLTTNHDLVPHTRRARLFMNSLSVISTGAVVYAAVSLFQPIRARFAHDQSVERAFARQLLEQYPASSEDFFKLWPHDKLFFFNRIQTAGLAYGVRGGVAMAVGDPFGDPADFNRMLQEFEALCYANGWTPAYIHTEPQHSRLYKQRGYSLQKLGEEAVVDTAAFMSRVATNKYFRNIRNKFEKQGYKAEVLQPPHDQAVVDRLAAISQEWLEQPGRAERGFMMGYFTSAYIQQCPVLVLRDHAGDIQAYLNIIPSFDKDEGNYDMLRYSKVAPGNANDFLLLSYLEYLHGKGIQRLNMGLCPLAGLDQESKERTVVDSALRFVYANGDRFYSFSGLRRFKAKYEPQWQGRYIAYPGGIGTFSRVLNALTRVMKI